MFGPVTVKATVTPAWMLTPFRLMVCSITVSPVDHVTLVGDAVMAGSAGTTLSDTSE